MFFIANANHELVEVLSVLTPLPARVHFAVACRRPCFCFGKSKQNQRDAKLAIHGSNSCITASLQRQKTFAPESKY
jgi:hypothetical protein